MAVVRHTDTTELKPDKIDTEELKPTAFSANEEAAINTSGNYYGEFNYGDETYKVETASSSVGKEMPTVDTEEI
jgi:hypothetical protein